MPAPAAAHPRRTRRSPLALALAALYLSALLVLTMLPASRPVAQYHNLVPLRSILFDLERGGLLLLINVLGNIVAFMPVGLLPPLLGLRRRAWLLVAGVAAELSTLIELLQLTLTRRVGDIDDVLLNLLGALLGYALYRLAARLRRDA